MERTALRLYFDQRVPITLRNTDNLYPMQRSIVPARLLHAGAMRPGIMLEGMFQRPPISFPRKSPFDDGEVFLHNRSRAEEKIHPCVGVNGPCEQDHSAHRTIDAVNKFEGRLATCCTEDAEQVGIACAIRLHRHRRWLLDGEQVWILEQYHQRRAVSTAHSGSGNRASERR